MHLRLILRLKIENNVFFQEILTVTCNMEMQTITAHLQNYELLLFPVAPKSCSEPVSLRKKYF